jgi:hypothetical protein
LSEKVVHSTLDFAGKVGKGHFKEDGDTSMQSKKGFDKSAFEGVHSKEKAFVHPKKGFAILERDAEESVRERREEYS